jgi:putative ABC transport system permease protein
MVSPTTHLSEAIGALARHPLRAGLTILGIVIGVAAVITVLAVSAGSRQRLIEQIQSLGGNLLLVTPGSARSGGVRLGAGSRPTLTPQDAEAITREVPGVVVTAPSSFRRLQVVHGNRNWSTTVQGITPEYLVAREWGIASGRPLSSADQANAAKVAVLGATVAHRVFPDTNPIGAVLRIAAAPLTVVGVLESKGQSAGGADQDDKVMIPLTTARIRIFGAGRVRPAGVDYIMIKVESAQRMGRVGEQTARLLRQRHRLAADASDDFTIRNLAEVQRQKREAAGVLTFWLTAVASVSLVVGAVSVMNTMLVAVAERTDEIGLRMAIGARQRDIRNQFLTEALLLSVVGGVVGIALGVAVAYAIAALRDLPVVLSPVDLLLALAAAGLAGIGSGVFPAMKAARLSPVEALRST